MESVDDEYPILAPAAPAPDVGADIKLVDNGVAPELDRKALSIIPWNQLREERPRRERMDAEADDDDDDDDGEDEDADEDEDEDKYNPARFDNDQEFCFICRFSVRNREGEQHPHVTRMEELWTNFAQNVVEATKKVQLYYNHNVRSNIPDRPEWTKTSIARHFVAHRPVTQAIADENTLRTLGRLKWTLEQHHLVYQEPSGRPAVDISAWRAYKDVVTLERSVLAKRVNGTSTHRR